MSYYKEQQQEAIKRMSLLEKTLDLNPKLLRYLKEGKVYYSYVVSGMFGCIDTINYDKQYAMVVDDFQKETGNFVYHAIETHTSFGKMLSLLYVSADKNEWPAERPDGEDIFAYVYNFDDDFGEYGYISLASDNGAMLRAG